MENNPISSNGLFRMTVGDHAVVGRPTRDDITQALGMLDGGQDSFMVMERSPQQFMQCSGSDSKRFQVEYRDGGDNPHYRCADDLIDTDIVVALFISYVNEDDRWRDMIGWVPLNQHVRIGPAEPTRIAPRVVERHGNHIVISRRFCMLIGGLLMCVLGAASFFLVGSISVTVHTNSVTGWLAVCWVMACTR